MNYERYLDDAKPMTRRELDRALVAADDRNTMACAPWKIVARIVATIENGGWAPEPPTEGHLREWLGRLGDRPFQDSDLHTALLHARNHGIHVTLDSTRTNRWLVIHGSKDYDCASLRIAARTIAALAYAEYHRGADVSGLLGGLA